MKKTNSVKSRNKSEAFVEKEDKESFLSRKRKKTDIKLEEISKILKISMKNLNKLYNEPNNNKKKKEYIATIQKEFKNLDLYRQGKILIHPFNTKVTLEDFIYLFLNAIIISLKYNTEQLDIQKKFLLKSFSSAQIPDLLMQNPLSDAKRDIFIANLSCLDETEYLSFEILETYEYFNYFEVMNIKKYDFDENTSIEELTFRPKNDDIIGQIENIPVHPFLKEHPIYDRSYLKQIALSTPVVQCYQKVLETQDIKVSLEDISSTLSKFISTVQIFYADINEFGFTINCGIIFISKSKVKLSIRSIPHAACVLLTVLHEFSRCLLRLVRNDQNFYFLTKVIQSNAGKKFKDSGRYFEYLLLGREVDKLFPSSSKFLLNLDNYNCQLADFHKNLIIELNEESEESCYISKSGGVPAKIICGTLNKKNC